MSNNLANPAGTIATDEVAGVHYQKNKIVGGGEDVVYELLVDSGGRITVNLSQRLSGEDATNGRMLVGPATPIATDSVLETPLNGTAAVAGSVAAPAGQIDLRGYPSCTIQIIPSTGPAPTGGTVAFSGSIDGTNWFPVALVDDGSTTPATLVASLPANAGRGASLPPGYRAYEYLGFSVPTWGTAATGNVTVKTRKFPGR